MIEGGNPSYGITYVNIDKTSEFEYKIHKLLAVLQLFNVIFCETYGLSDHNISILLYV